MIQKPEKITRKLMNRASLNTRPMSASTWPIDLTGGRSAGRGGSLIKPSVVGTVARTTTADSKSLGYSIYYMLVNIGGAVGPLLAVPVRENLGIAYVLVMSSATTFLLLDRKSVV